MKRLIYQLFSISIILISCTLAKPGTMKWKFSANSQITNTAIGPDGIVYINSMEKLYAIKPNSTIKWETKVGGGPPGSSPVIIQDTNIYVASKKLYAFNNKGVRKWVINNNAITLASSSNGTIYSASRKGKLFAINNKGKVKWKYDIDERPVMAMSPSPVVNSAGEIYIGTDKLYAIKSDGEKKWQFEKKDEGEGIVSKITSSLKASFIPDMTFQNTPAIGYEGTIYIGCTEDPGKLFAINPDGTKKWKFEGAGAMSDPVIGLDSNIYVGKKDGSLYAIDNNGNKVWALKEVWNPLSTPVIGSDSTIYLGNPNGKVLAINPEGTKKWEYQTGGGIISSPTIGNDGTIYIGSDSTLYVIESECKGPAETP